MANNNKSGGGIMGFLGTLIVLVIVCFIAGMIWNHSGGTSEGFAATIVGILDSIVDFFKSIFAAGQQH